MRVPAIAAAALVLAAPCTAAATWSIVAVDPVTHEVGVAVASCVEAPAGSTILPQVAALAPGVGALAAQALWNQATRDMAAALLEGGTSPAEVIAVVNASDPQSSTRQYGVVTLDLQTAGFTGPATSAWAGDLQGPGVSVQGNILYGADVVGDALAAFTMATERCPVTLADRLMLALEAGAAQGGDNRCSKAQSALAATIKVAGPNDDADAPTLDLRIPSQPEGGDNPVALLRIEYDAWRLANPPDASGCAEGTTGDAADGSGEGTTSSASTGAATTSGSGSATSSGSGSGEGAPDPGTTSTAAAPTGSGAQADDGVAEGCACRPTSHPRGAQFPVALALGLLVHRRRRATES